ncbi:DEAD/DEAH box helicase [Fontisphaera persica]|uniref:helicase-related protein n=1 Tax=Fontisphaera persica TaxID=2974023 RepID=UPI0024BFD20A|nr:DEAD/DEAH box helicase [Fontisphaera persica]WCJ59607.1 DEAD/DEAH box helicase [Fontisphaera persica]
MNTWHPLAKDLRLYVPGRITETDARRQQQTAAAILHRLAHQPGVVLADEVGMGKTFVALAVAASVALSDARRRPVVVMVPPSLKEKWPSDFRTFQEECLPAALRHKVRAASADSAVEFLKLLDDPPEHRHSIIFLTHGAMHRGLGHGRADAWIKLAVIQRALRGRHQRRQLERGLYRCLGRLLFLQGVQNKAADIWQVLLSHPPEQWLTVLHEHGIDPEGDANPLTDDDPVPRVIIQVLHDFDTSHVYEALKNIPLRLSVNYEERIERARHILGDALKQVWRACLQRLQLRLPLLILDEAHHLKNPSTQLAGLFQNPDAELDAEEIRRGVLGGIFERMLFLTATPFQLGHHELCSVLERFDGIAWEPPYGPAMSRAAFQHQLRELRQKLDAAQAAAINFDKTWGDLRPEDLVIGEEKFGLHEVVAWWEKIQVASHKPAVVENLLASFRRTFERMREAEQSLRPWVIRHLKSRTWNGLPRRELLPGKAIIHDCPEDTEAGIEVSNEALLPFLLAARATACTPESRPIFAEGLASSFEAFLHTRHAHWEGLDGDEEPLASPAEVDPVARWYLDQLTKTLPLRDHRDSATHPKVKATAQRVLEAWRQGEKVVVFCHYLATGRALRQVISNLLTEEITSLAAKKLQCKPQESMMKLELLGQRFFKSNSPLRQACDAELSRILKEHPALAGYKVTLQEIVRRFLRTPSFLVRFFPLSPGKTDAAAVQQAFTTKDSSGACLRDLLEGFFEFLERRCAKSEREGYLNAINSIQTGNLAGREVQETISLDEQQGTPPEKLLPNVRLVNGKVRPETRQTLMLAFNSPFFPEILIASSVMSEGVDLHRFCRYVIHHDLCWNPSTLEQRTGRVDRIGAKVERCGQPIRVYLPFLAETQDEKLYRVVMDRQRWFSVVMGEKFQVDARTTEKLAQRVPLPPTVAQQLAFQLAACGT